MHRTTAKDLKESIKKCAADAFATSPTNADRRARLFCAFFSNQFETSDPAVFTALQKAAGIDRDDAA